MKTETSHLENLPSLYEYVPHFGCLLYTSAATCKKMQKLGFN